MKTRQGYVYFIQMGEDGPVKIGYSTSVENLRRRLDFMQVGNPTPLLLRGVIRGTQSDEQKLHRDVRDDRLRGEWFRLSSAVSELLSECEAVDDLPVVRRRDSVVRLGEDEARSIWNDPTLTEAEALHRMTGWSAHYARKLLGGRLGLPPRHTWSSEQAKIVGKQSWKSRKAKAAPITDALRVWKDTVKYPRAVDVEPVLKAMGWSGRSMHAKFPGGRYPEIGFGRPRKPKT